MKEKINSLLDKFCEICYSNQKNSCDFCNLQHRRIRLDDGVN